MAFGSFSNAADSTPMAEINMVPLIDVMLVLLVIFIITAPLLTHAVKIDLPKASSHSNVMKRETIQLAIEADGAIHWNGERIDQSTVAARMAAAAKQTPQPEIHLHADGTTQYHNVAEVMSAAAQVGLTRIGFVTEPTRPH